MPKKNDIWNEAFNNPDLSSEDWLEPSADLFDKIEKDVTLPKKKRKLGFLIFLLGLTLLALLVGLYLSDSDKKDKIDSKQKIEEIEESTLIIAESENSIPFDENKKDFSDTEDISTHRTEKKDKRTASLAGFHDLNTGIDPVLRTTGFSTSENIISNDALKISNTYNSPESTFASKNSVAVSKVILPGVTKRDRKVLSLKSLIGVQNFQLAIPERKFAVSPIFVSKLENSKYGNTISLFTGISVWGFHLNNNYLTALDPADFTFESGSGKTMAFRYDHHVKNKLSIFGTLSWDRVVSYSGHNSKVNYDLQNESNDLSNTLDLTMASPFGLLQSDVVVSRNSSVSQDQTSLVLDLHNRHQFDNVGLSGGLAYMLIAKNGFEFSSHLGLGLNYLVGLENELESFDLSSSDFSSGETSITQNQQAVNSFSTQLNLGFSLKRSWGQHTLVGVSIDYMRGLSDVYGEDDFSSRLSARRYNLSLSRRF